MPINMEQTAMRKFFARFGAYRVPRGLFYHRQLWQRLTVIGFRVLSVERLATHPVWRIRLKGTLAAQADLLLSQPASIRVCARSRHWLEQQLKEWMQKILKHLGHPVPSGPAGRSWSYGRSGSDGARR